MAATSMTTTLLLATAFCIASASVYAKVDPWWLASWNEAVANKPSELTSFAKMVADDEPGTRLLIRGRVVDPNGDPAEGVVVHAYHRDNNGFDFGLNDKELTTWRIQGWALTDPQGRFTFDTIKAAPDHMGREGGHIHFTTMSAQYGKQWALKAYFSDDKLLTAEQKLLSQKAGEFGPIRDIETTSSGALIHVTLKLKTKPDF